MNKITELRLSFNEPHTEESLLRKGFVKNEDSNMLFNLKMKELNVYYIFKTARNVVKYTELVVQADDSEGIKMYTEAKEFYIKYALEVLKSIDINICESVEIHGLGDIREQLLSNDKNWISPSWINNSLLYINEFSGLSYHQCEGFYRICYEKENTNIQELFK